MNSDASQSSSSGCVGHSPCEPRSSSTFDRPVPKNCRHVRLTNDARRQRIVARHQPVRQVEPRARARPSYRACRGSAESRARRSRRVVHPVAARQDARHRRIDRRGREDARDRRVEQAALGLDPLHVGVVGREVGARPDPVVAERVSFRLVAVLRRPPQRPHHLFRQTARPRPGAARIPAACASAGVAGRRPRKGVGRQARAGSGR